MSDSENKMTGVGSHNAPTEALSVKDTAFPSSPMSIPASSAVRPATSKLVGSGVLRPDIGQPHFGTNIVVGQTRLGTSVVTDVIGEGGMATVYKVWNEGLEVYRAVKLLSHEASSARFETEAKIIAKLHHEGIVEVYNIGVWNGVPFMEMEMIDGFDLQNALSERGRLPETVCVAIAVVVSEALAHAHTQTFTLSGKQYRGIIHRDLKPANIMISKDGKVKLTDFGIARPAQASIHTVEGGIVGTLHYLAPEQMDGGKVDNRSDIYSFGTILYEMLTGERTFPQDAIAELVLRKSLNEYKPIEEYGLNLNADLVKIINRCLEQAPDARYQRTQDIVADLRRVYASMTERPPKDVVGEYFNGPADPSEVAAVAAAAEKSEEGHRPSWAMETATPSGDKTDGDGGKDAQRQRKSGAAPLSGGSAPKPKKSKLPYIAAAALLCSAIPFALIISNRGNEESPAMELSAAVSEDGAAEAQGSMGAAPPEQQEEAEEENARDYAPPPAKDTKHAPAKREPATKAQTKTQQTAKAVKTPAPQTAAKDGPSPPPPSPVTPKASVDGDKNETELLREAALAANKRDWAAAISILEKESAFPTQKGPRTLHLFNAYVEALQLNKAQAIMDTTSLTQDAYFLFCAGKFWRYRGRPDMAIKYFEAAVAGRSIVGTRNLLPDAALYYIAELRHDRYVANPTAASKAAALDAWNKVSDVMLSKPNNPMMKRAVREIAALSD